MSWRATATTVHIYTEDCNKVLLRDVFPRVKYGEYRRGLCLLDPYNINLTWDVIEAAGKSESIVIFLNFMIMDINRNALRKRMEKSLQSKVDQLTRLVGDDSWKDAGYREVETPFGADYQKVSNEEFAEWFRQRLITKAGFKHVPKPMPMTTKNNAVIYYLYFASHKDTALHIVKDIFRKYRQP